jgi:hypothetical protein
MFPIFMPQLKGHLWNIPENSILPLGCKMEGELMRATSEAGKVWVKLHGDQGYPYALCLIAQRINV